MYLFLDDKRKDQTVSHNSERGISNISKSNNWSIVRSYQEFVEFVNNNFDLIELISFDHDISSYDENDKELTGKDAAEFLIYYCIDNNKNLPDWFVHSDNNKGNENIRSLLINYLQRIEGKAMGINTLPFGYFNGTFLNHR